MSASPPQHIAIIMDGNGRWAREKGLARIEGHRAGAKSVRAVVEESCRLGIRYLTLYSFSSENWKRGVSEVTGLMDLFREYLDSELATLLDNGVRLRAIGDLSRLPAPVRMALSRNIEKTKNNSRLDLVLALSYGSRDEILMAAKSLAHKVARKELSVDDISEETFSHSLWTSEIPDPDLVIRSSGEMRVSNFLLWQVAYSEFIIRKEFWPDFNESTLRECVEEFHTRERRYGMTSEQVQQAI